MNWETDVLREGDRATRLVVWLLVSLMVISFVFGVLMYLPAEHRAQKLQQMEQKYQSQHQPSITERIARA
ncbi:MAG TPA: hypothetical protein EYQ50_17825 [Verrucomicrobiales bacterium]|nr:hypothetical protein [Verrucomicrobiales bacterium]